MDTNETTNANVNPETANNNANAEQQQPQDSCFSWKTTAKWCGIIVGIAVIGAGLGMLWKHAHTAADAAADATAEA